MILVKDKIEMQRLSKELSLKGKIGFVPTMGYLHEGHLSLVERAKEENPFVVVSIYVNPTQFGADEDLDKYPRDLNRDLSMLKKYDIDYVFFPDNKMMYPDGYKTYVEVTEISNILCGKSRPTHFKGVTTVVSKLMNIVKPDFMYMGEKDYQQIVVLETMIRDLNFTTKIVRCPIVREKDGLAMSSRNRYLSEERRSQSIALYSALNSVKEMIKSGNSDIGKLKQIVVDEIEKNSGKLDYFEIVDSKTLAYVKTAKPGDRALIAVFYDKTRLIDNIEL